MMDLAEQIDFAEYRAALYGQMSVAFLQEPTVDVLDTLMTAAQSVCQDDCVRASEAALFQGLLALRAKVESTEELRVEVASEYAELFIGPRPPLAPLYESIYLGFPHRLLTEQTVQVRSFYQRFGLQVERLNQVPDDHMGYETQFMADLCQREVEALQAGDTAAADDLRHAQLEFLAWHLGSWAGLFAHRVAGTEGFGYYAAWSAFVRDFTAEDDAYLSDYFGIKRAC